MQKYFQHAIAAVVVASCASQPAFALQGSAEAEEPIDEIQVTASRRPVAAAKVSAALTLVTAEDIRGEKLATDALAAQAGVYLQQTTVGQGAPIIRGLKGSEVLHLVDGLRLNNAIFRNAPTQYLALVAPGSIERMEVVRGSPTSLYGSDAVGGVIQVISRLPVFDTESVNWRREISVSADTAELGKSVQASVDVGTRRRAMLLSGAWQESGNRRTGGGERIGPSGYESYSMRGAVLLRPADDVSWVADVQFTRQPETPRVDELVPGFGQVEPSSSEYYFAPNERSFAHVRHTRDDGWLGADWTIDAGWQRIVDDRRTRDFEAATRRFEQNSSDLYGLSLNASGEAGAASWVVGLEAYYDKVRSARQERNVATGAESIEQSRFPDGASIRQQAIFANVSRPLAARHTLAGGVRVSAVDIDLTATAFSTAATVNINDVSADLGWIFDLSGATQLVANIGHGFRAPNIFDRGTLGERPGNRFNIPNPALASERVLHYDLGLRHRAGSWSGELVAYQLRYTDRIQSALTGDTTSDGRDIVQSRNLGRARIHGVEAGLNWRPPGPWSAAFIINYTYGEQREEDGSQAAGDRIPPLNGRLQLTRELSPVMSLATTAVFADGQGRLSPRDLRDTRIDPLGTAGWGQVSIELDWEPNETWRLRAGLHNLFDQRYRVHGSGLDAPGRGVLLTATAAW